MNEARFIELLNLYVDQQLSTAEAIELEAAIQENPARRCTYNQYCRMQKACAQLFEHERSEAPAHKALARAMAEADRKVRAPATWAARRPAWSMGFSFAAVAAAACVAFVVVRQHSGREGAELQVATTKTAETTAIAVMQNGASAEKTSSSTALAAKAAAEARANEFKPVFTAQLLTASSAKTDGLFLSAAQEEARQLEWTQHVQFKPVRKVSAEAFVFDQHSTEPVDKAVTTRLSTGGAAEEGATEMNAFQFQR